MDDMPETIAAWRFLPEKADEWVRGGWSDDHDHKTVAYTRTDRANELVAAAYEAAAEAGSTAAESDEADNPEDIASAIRSLTPADAVAALAARDARMRQAARLEMVKELGSLIAPDDRKVAMRRLNALLAKDRADGQA